MDKDKKILKKNKVVEYNPEEEKALDMYVEMNKYIFPIMTVNENSNVDGIGYIKENNTLFVQYKCMAKSVEGFELGMRPEPIGYFYHDVPVHMFEYLMHAENKGQYINNLIKKNYEFHLEPIMNP